MMVEKGTGAALVSDAESPTPGIVTERDLLISVGAGEDPDVELVADHMSERVIAAAPDWSLERAAAEMSRRGVRHLVVFDGGRGGRRPLDARHRPRLDQRRRDLGMTPERSARGVGAGDDRLDRQRGAADLLAARQAEVVADRAADEAAEGGEGEDRADDRVDEGREDEAGGVDAADQRRRRRGRRRPAPRRAAARRPSRRARGCVGARSSLPLTGRCRGRRRRRRGRRSPAAKPPATSRRSCSLRCGLAIHAPGFLSGGRRAPPRSPLAAEARPSRERARPQTLAAIAIERKSSAR